MFTHPLAYRTGPGSNVMWRRPIKSAPGQSSLPVCLLQEISFKESKVRSANALWLFLCVELSCFFAVLLSANAQIFNNLFSSNESKMQM